VHWQEKQQQKARREAEEAELKAVLAREAAQAAAREELEATRNEYEANFTLEDVPETSNQSPSARRYCCSILQHVNFNC
jgi:Tfp pilus assembly protein PilO